MNSTMIDTRVQVSITFDFSVILYYKRIKSGFIFEHQGYRSLALQRQNL
nr:MAG TPA: hypothetical protein [Bacteriophage sp.]